MMHLSDYILHKDLILLDGAMGTQLASSGLQMGGQNNLANPQEVQSIHLRYAQCGSHILTTNTLTMNRIYIETHNLNISVREVNLAGAKLAKSAAGSRHYVLGDIGCTGKLLEPYGDLAEADAYETFKEQASVLAEGGVDGFILETMIDLREALLAVRACQRIASIPIIASMSFENSKNGAHTIMGNSVSACAENLTDAGVFAVGANCGNLDPVQMASIVSEFRRATSLPILAMPNAGMPKLVGRCTIFDMTPSDFAAGLAECIKAGAHLVGGCCGTTPEHISAIKDLSGI
jgi:methionine synthase I (cobalamin-dependent)